MSANRELAPGEPGEPAQAAASFPLAVLDLLACPREGGRLSREEGWDRGGERAADERVTAATVRCSVCGGVYPIRDGVLDLLGQPKTIEASMAREIAARDRQAEVYDSFFTALESEEEIRRIVAALEPRARMTLLELGAGTGRVTEHLLPFCQQLCAVDFSRESLLRLARRLSGDPRLALVRADATSLRLPASCYDRVVSSQLLEHIPTLARRLALYRAINGALRPGGRFVCTAYHYGLWQWSEGREGFHSSGIYFRRFTVADLRHELGAELEVQVVRPIRVEVPLARRLRLPGAWLSRAFEQLPVTRLLGDLVLATSGK